MERDESTQATKLTVLEQAAQSPQTESIADGATTGFDGSVITDDEFRRKDPEDKRYFLTGQS